MTVGIRLLGLVALAGLATACIGEGAGEALESLKSGTFSPKYQSGFWASEAEKQTDLWKEAQQLCRAQEATPTPNCRVVAAVDLTVRIIAIREDEDLGERLKTWIRAGTRELGLPTSGSMPPSTRGFGPKPPRMPESSGK
jgi:hypothetical protein